MSQQQGNKGTGTAQQRQGQQAAAGDAFVILDAEQFLQINLRRTMNGVSKVMVLEDIQEVLKAITPILPNADPDALHLRQSTDGQFWTVSGKYLCPETAGHKCLTAARKALAEVGYTIYDKEENYQFPPEGQR